MAWYLPKWYVGVHTRVENYHKDHTESMSITTEFRLEMDIAIFKATVVTKKWIFNWSSFGRLEKEKAFEKLETVAVWRALAFAWYEVKSWIASSEEMENFRENEKEVIKWYNDVEKNMENWKEMITDWKATPEWIIKKILWEWYKISSKNKDIILWLWK